MPTTTKSEQRVIGNVLPLVVVRVTSPGTTTIDVIIPGMRTIEAAFVQVLDAGDRVATSDADVTWSGNVVTIADGGSFSLADTQVLFILAAGVPRAV